MKKNVSVKNAFLIIRYRSSVVNLGRNEALGLFQVNDMRMLKMYA